MIQPSPHHPGSADTRRALFDEYLPRIMQCRLEDLVVETPVQEMPGLSERLGLRVLVKREDLQPVFSFKLRGAYAKLKSLTAAERQRGVICASAGNHAQGVAMAARQNVVAAVSGGWVAIVAGAAAVAAGLVLVPLLARPFLNTWT